MAQRTLKSVLAGGTLVVAMTLGSPAHAVAGPGIAGFWSWLAGSWGERVGAVWPRAGQAHEFQHSGIPRDLEKAGGCIDPNGCANGQTTGSTPSLCTRRSDQGTCLDPNG
jgi:hypothetical protein